MSVDANDRDRRVIPRWRAFSVTVQTGVLSSSGTVVPRTSTSQLIDEQRAAWQSERTFGFAADYLASAVAVGRVEEARDAAELVLATPGAPVSLQRMALRSLGRGMVEIAETNPRVPIFGKALIHKEIHDLRRRLREEPRNGILWVDLARSYECIALRPQAEAAMTMALRLFPTNRFVLRCASRMFIHHGDIERGHAILRSCPMVKSDPWLLAAEIAAASISEKASSLIKHGQEMLQSRRIVKLHLSELASAIGTVELVTGNQKRGKKLIVSSLDEPTDNAVAQAAWTVRKFNAADVARAVIPISAVSQEAQAWEFAGSGKWHDAVDASTDWLRDDPISGRPACLGSYLASTALGDFRKAIKFADHGLVANPGEFTLLNNKAVSLAQLGEVEEAKRVFDQTKLQSLPEELRIVWVATSGLLMFRSGAHEEGGALYQAAIEAAEKMGDLKRAAMAVAHLAMEEHEAELASAVKTAKRALDLLDKTPVKEAERIIKELKRIAGIAETTETRTTTTTPRSAPPARSNVAERRPNPPLGRSRAPGR